MATSVLEARGVGFVYKTSRGPITAVDKADLIVEAGEFVAIVGPSGSGKSTLLALLAGLLKPSSGEVLFKGQAWGGLTDGQVCAKRSGEIGLMFQDGGLLPGLRAIDNVLLAAVLSGIRHDEAMLRARELLDRVGLGDRWDAYPREMSGGQRRRVGLARSLAARPGVILADEPTGDLDQLAAREIIFLLEGIRADCKAAVVVVTHDPALEAIADKVFEVKSGRCLLKSKKRVVAEFGDVHCDKKNFDSFPPNFQSNSVFEPSPPGLVQTEPGTGFLSIIKGWGLFLGISIATAGMVAFLDGFVAGGQRSTVIQTKTKRKLAEEMALQDLRAEVEDVAMTPEGTVTVNLFLQNFNSGRPMYLLGPAIEVGTQQNNRWIGVPLETGGGMNEIRKVTREKTALTIRFSIAPVRYDELFPGYIHLRIGASMVVSDNPMGGGDLFDRRDAYYIYLRDPRRTEDDVRRANGWGPKSAVPLWISMPSH